MFRRDFALMFMAFVLATLGCASARYVYKDSDSGVVAIPSNSVKNREKAIELMQQHFPSGYVIDREEETVIGQTTHHQVDHGSTVQVASAKTTESGQVTSTSTTVDKKEYRIFYRSQ